MRKILVIIIICAVTNLFSFEISNPDSINVILNKFAENLGEVQKVKYLNMEYHISQNLKGNDLTFWSSIQIVFPDNLILKFADYTIELDSKKAFRKYDDGFYEKLNPEISDKFRQPLKKNLIYLAKYYKQMAFETLELIDYENGQAYIITNKDKTLTLYIDKSSYIIYQIKYVVDDQLRIKRYSDYKNFGKIKYPTKIKVTDNEGGFISGIEVIKLDLKMPLKKK